MCACAPDLKRVCKRGRHMVLDEWACMSAHCAFFGNVPEIREALLTRVV